jgi:hypothetical protein
LLYYFALSRELSFQEVVAFGNLGGVSVAKAKEVAAELFIRLRRKPRALPVDECVTCVSTPDVSKLDASADFASAG